MAKPFRCRLVTPVSSLLDEEVSYASIPAWDGSMGVLPSRAPILARLGVGELRLEFPDSTKGQGGKRSYLLEGGFVQMLNNNLTILAERATPAESITLADAESELKAAEAKSVPADASNRALKQTQLQHEREVARAKVHMAKNRGAI
ncbi:MAG: F0F1 ATP synthase subunit epsilon [Planctomycetota bacterium]|nr:F0F1 ATP synthase subunit epsilon [Planctomycetota bacterium]